jgi:ligand-binding sensor domain-containing protein/tRNA A-37 threonylcarbamoyl transferase component Bud32
MNEYTGKRLGSYQLLEQIGQGGMATIFKAYQPSMDRYVAVKILPRHFTEDETFEARFTQEAHTLARLEHPHILPVHDYGEQEGITYLVMRYVEAGTLKELIAREGVLELDEIARIVEQVGHALGYAHSQGVVHRDIKPSNVLIDERGDVFLTDFGIAKLVAGTSQFTATGAVVGTPAYMSPEQGLGEMVDQRSDIYSLGVVLYEMATGRVPFEAETPLAVLLKHVNAPLPPPRQVKPDLSPAVERVILKAMAKSPEDRFQTAEEMVEALQKAVAELRKRSVLSTTLVEPDQMATAAASPKARVTPAGLEGEKRAALPWEPVSEPAAVGRQAPTPRRPLPFKGRLVPIVGGVATLVALLVVALLVLSNRGGDRAEATPTPVLAVAQPTTQMSSISVANEIATEAVPGQSTRTSEMIVDNGDPDFMIEVGDWGTCWDGDCQGISYGDDFRYAEPGCGSCRARFEFSVTTAGEYDVWTWWPQGEDRATDTLFTIVYSGGPYVVEVDQRNDGSRWYQLGTLSFEAGESVSIVVAGTDSGYANADAVALTSGVTPEPMSDLDQLPPGWTNYSNGNFVRDLVRQGDYLWAGGEGGLVRWDLRDGSYVKFGLANELPSNHVNDLLVDADGNLWVATDAGLSRFDGATWLTFNRVDGLDSDDVETLLLDNDGALWAGTDGGALGLNVYDGTSWGAPSVPAIPVESPTVSHLFTTSNNGLWVSVGEEGLGYFDGVEWRLAIADGLPGGYVYALLLTGDDEVWASSDDGVIRRDPETGEWKAIPQLEDKEIYAIHQSRDGLFWFAGDGGAVRYDPVTGDWEAFEPRPGRIPDRPITSMIEDDEGLWLGTEGGGVLFYDGEDWEAWDTDDELGGNDIYAIRQDGSGALWFTHPGSGLSRYNPADDTWRTFGENEGASDWASYPGVDLNGQLWIGGDDELKWYDGTAWRGTEQLAGAGTIFGIAFGPDGVAWLWSENGVTRYDPSTGEQTTFTAADHPVLEDVDVIDIASDGTVWTGSEVGLAYYDGSGWRGPDTEGDAPERDVQAVAEGYEGVLWVVADGALYSLEAGQWSRFERPDGGWIDALAIEPGSETVWVGGDGLDRFDTTWQLFTTDDGLINNRVQAIYVTSDGVLWVGTEGGVSRYVPGD